MNAVLLYVLLLKAIVMSFSGLSSLPILREDLVVRHGVLTDRQLNAALVAGRTGPGPLGIYVVSIGYVVGGPAGAAAGALAMMTPAFLIIPMLRYLGARADRPSVKRVIRAVTLASAGLIISSTAPLARESITGPIPLVIAATSFLLLTVTRVDSIWVILGSAAAGLGGFLLSR